jgi:hypothetical protein
LADAGEMTADRRPAADLARQHLLELEDAA